MSSIDSDEAIHLSISWEPVLRTKLYREKTIDWITSIKQARCIQHAFDFPLILLTRATDIGEMNIVETSLQVKFLKLSSSSKEYFSTYDDHYIQTQGSNL